MTAINPVSDSPLEGYWGVDGSQHVIFIGTDDHIHQLDVARGATGWVDNDLTALTGPPPYTIPESVPRSGLGGFCGADNSQQVNYVGGDIAYICSTTSRVVTAGWMELLGRRV